MTLNMPIADGTVDVLTGITRALNVPIRIASILLLLLLVVELGRAVAEAARRHRRGRQPLDHVAINAMANPSSAFLLAQGAPSSLAERAVVEMAGAAGRSAVERALTHFELGVQRRLDRTRMLVRAGPAVGLMGTLVPLGPGIAALGRGDVAALADDLQTAFAATVVGILVGTVSFALTLARTRTYSEELSALESAAESAGVTSARPVATTVAGAL